MMANRESVIIPNMLDQVLARIDKRLKAVNLAESTAAVKAGLSDSAIRNMRRAVAANKQQGASIKTLSKLAPVLQTSVTWLMEESGPEVVTNRFQPVAPVDVPKITWISAGQLTGQEGVLDFSEFPTVAALDLPQGEWIALEVVGDSMNKISPPGSTIFVNLKDKRLAPNALYVVADETGAATYKRYRPNDDPPFQPASYHDVEPPEFEGAVNVVGRVRRSIIEM
jgi:SOS-response transcriptional repressor LexA